MQEYYKTEFLQLAKKQRKDSLLILLLIAGIYLLISTGLFIWYTTLPYMSPVINIVKIIHYVLTAIFVVVFVMYLSIKYKRVNDYYKKCVEIQTGLVEENFGSFIEFDETLQTKDGVDFKSALFLEYRERKKDFFERKVLIFYEHPCPDFQNGQTIKYITQGNVLKLYEIEKNLEEDNKWEQ